MTVVFPEGTTAEGNVKVNIIPAGANLAALTLAEINAGVDVSGYIMAGQFTPASEQGRGTNRRLGSKQTFQRLGRVNPSIGDLQYVYDPQAAALDPDNEAYETFVQDYSGIAVVRYGLDAQTVDWALAQKYDAWPIEMGAQHKNPPPEDDEFALLTVTQAVAVTGIVVRDGVITA